MRAGELSEKQKIILMGKCGGKCEFRGCETNLLEDFVTNQKENFSNYAHIIANSENGPRGSKKNSKELAKDENNIIVLCPNHHKLIDAKPEEYTVQLLREMKKEHEKYIKEIMTIPKENHVIGIKYSSSISNRIITIPDEEILRDTLKQKMYCTDNIISLSGTTYTEKELENYYELEKNNIKEVFYQEVRPLQKKVGAKKFFLFAIGPQPLLIYIGTLFSDISNVEVQQLQREPVREWFLTNKKEDNFNIELIMPKKRYRKVALNISITGDISEERIKRALGEECDIVKIESNIHGNDIIKSKKQVELYRQTIREAYEKIKDAYGEDCEINIFPAMPISLAVETGRCWMKKIHPKLKIYDEKKGFKKALEITNKEDI